MTGFAILDGMTDADLAAAATAPRDGWADAVAQDRQQRVAAAAVSTEQATPEQVAEGIKLAGQTGIPADVAARNLPDVKRRAYRDQVERVMTDQPDLVRWYMNPVNAQLTRDDLDNIAKLPNLWRGLADTGRSLVAGAVTGTGAALSGVGEFAAATDRGLARFSDALLAPIFPDAAANRAAAAKMAGFVWEPSRVLTMTGQAVSGVGQDVAPPTERQNTVDKVGSAVGGFAPLLVAEILGGPVLAGTVMAAQGADQQAVEARRASKEGTPQGDVAVVAGAAVNAMLQTLGFEQMLHRIPPQMRNAFAAKLTDMTIAGGIQAAQQALLTASQNAVTKTYLDPQKDIYGTDQAIEDGVVGFATGALVRGGLVRVQPTDRIVQQRAAVATSEQDAAALDRIMAGVKDTKLAERSPEKMSELLQSLGDGRNVFVPVETVREYFQKLEPEEAQRQAQQLGIDKQIPEAVATGGDVVIPLHQYVAHAPEDMAAAWRDDIRMRSAGMSINEAKAFKGDDQARADELGKTVAGSLEQTTRETQAREAVVTMVERQLVQAGEAPETARQIAQLYGERYTTRAQRLGQGDAESAYAKSGVEFQSDLPQVIKHAPADDLELLIKALKGKTDRSEKNAKGPTILQYIARNGGIIDDAGELSARDVDKYHLDKPFQRRVLREAPQPEGGGFPGLTEGAGDRSRYGVDEWARRLWEEGFFPKEGERPSMDHLYAAIDDEMRGKPHYMEHPGREWQSDFDSAVRDLDEVLTKAGIDSRKASVAEIRDALSKMSSSEGGRGFDQPVYHGSPHLFDRFSLDHIGKGEGAQAFGWGLYFAGRKQIAQHYRDTLASDHPADIKAAKQFLIDQGIAPDAAHLEDMYGYSNERDYVRLAIQGGFKPEQRGRLYHVEIPDDGAYLLWDKEFSEQPQAVQDALVKLFHGHQEFGSNDAEIRAALHAVSGEEIYRHLGEMMSEPEEAPGWTSIVPASSNDKAASVALRELGVPGIKYLAGTSRSKGEGDHNYVLFNDSLAKVSKYEQAKEPVATVNGDELAPVDADLKTLRAAARSFWDENIKGGSVDHPDLGKIEFTGSGRSKFFSATANPDKLRLVPMLRDIVANGTLVGSEVPADKAPRSTIVAYHRLEAPVQVGDRKFNVGVTVFEDDRGNKFYNLATPDNTKGARPVHRNDGGGAPPVGGTGVDNPTYRQNVGSDPDGVNIQILGQEGGRTPRGNITFARDADGQIRSLVTLFKDRNLSTVLHETGHLWLEELHDDASHPQAPDQLKADLATARDYLGAKGDDPLTVEQHETWARTVEAYLMEGKSPSVALSDVLARFKAWMISVYKTVRGLRVEMTPEIRGVMDRLIATDDAIAEARDELGARQLFASADQAGMTEAEFKAYSDSVTRTRDKAEQDVLDKLLANVRRQRTAEWRHEIEAVTSEVRSTVETSPDLVALEYLRSGELPGTLAHLRDAPRLKLSREALIEEYGNPEIVNALPKSVPPLVTERGGVRPGDIAELLGWPDVRSMIDSLTALAKEQAALKGAGDKRSVRQSRLDAEVGRVMEERHGNMLTNGSIEAEALSALHNQARSDVLAAEVRALARQSSEEATPYKLARDWAKRAIAEKPVGDVSDLSQYTRAEAKAAKAAEQALAKGDHDEALRRKQEQMIAHALWMEARDAKAEVETQRKMMDRLAATRTSKSMDQDYLEKIHDLLERFDLKARSVRAVERAESLRAWAEQAQKDGRDVAVPEKLLDEAYKTNYRRMSVEEFRGLSDSIKQLAHLGRLKQELLDGEQKRQFDAVVDEGVAAAGKGRQSGNFETDAGKTDYQRRFGNVGSKLRSADAALLKMEYLFKWLDGNKGAAPFSRLFQRMSLAQSGEKTQQGDLATKLHALFHEIPAETRRRMQDVDTYPELGGQRLRRDALMSVALNMGNEGNKDKMMRGHGWNEEAVIRAINRGLGKEEMAFVQKTWDLIETLWPQIAAMERRVNGVEPEKVERSELVTKHGTFAGGYFPLVYEPRREAQAGDPNTGIATDDLGSPIYTRATTPKGFTKERNENFARPIHLSLDVIPRHMMEVVHDIHWRETLMDGQRYLGDARIKNAIREKLGFEYEAQMQPWLNHMAMEYAKDRQGMAAWDQAMKTLRTNVSMVGMGFRLSTIFSQVGGLSDSTAEIGVRWMASGARAYASHPIDSAAFVREKSGEMMHRAETLDRDLHKVTKTLSGKDSLLDPVREFAYAGIGYADAAVTIPTWLGAFNKGQHEGMSEHEAVQYADGIVRQSQGASGTKDMVRLQTSGEAGKLITMFYSYFSHYYNAQRDVGRRLIDATYDRSPADFGKALARAFWLNGPGVLAAQFLSGQGPAKDESWGAWAARTMFFNQFMGVPIVRDLAAAGSNAIAGKYVGGYQLSPAGKSLETLMGLAHDAYTTVKGKPTPDHWIQHAVTSVGYATALPTGQLGTTTQFLYDALWSHQASPQTVGDWLKGLAFGPEPKK